MVLGYEAWEVKSGIGASNLKADLNELERDLYKPMTISIQSDGGYVIAARKQD